MIAIGLALGAASLVWAGTVVAVQTAPQRRVAEPAIAPLTSMLYRFDPATQSFFTVPLPLGSAPVDVAVAGVNPVQIWVTAPGRDQIVRLVFTNTADYQLSEYWITSTVRSQPFHITVSGNNVWFTERGANRVGRLNAVTGQLDEFYGQGLAANAGLADIQIAPDGAVWLTGQQSNQIMRLTVNSPSDYTFQSFTNTLLIGPYELAIENEDSIWFSVPAVRRAGRLMPSVPNFTWPQVVLSGTYGIVFHNNSSWITDRDHNRIIAIAMDTWTAPDFYGPISRPAEIAVRQANTLWITQQSRPAAVARFVVTTANVYRLDSFRLPLSRLLPTGISVAADNTVWLTAYQPHDVYLPAVFKATR